MKNASFRSLQSPAILRDCRGHWGVSSSWIFQEISRQGVAICFEYGACSTELHNLSACGGSEVNEGLL